MAFCRDFHVMRYEHQCHAMFPVHSEHQFDNVLSCFGVEIAGRFVGEQKRRFSDEGTCQCDALLFSAGKVSGIMSCT